MSSRPRDTTCDGSVWVTTVGRSPDWLCCAAQGNLPALLRTCEHGHAGCLRLLLDHGVDPRSLGSRLCPQSDGSVPLIVRVGLARHQSLPCALCVIRHHLVHSLATKDVIVITACCTPELFPTSAAAAVEDPSL